MPILTFDELAEQRPVGFPSIVGDGLLPEAGKFLLVGETEAGKSVLALDIAIRLVLAKPLFDAVIKKHNEEFGFKLFPVHRPCKILYVDTELGPIGCHERTELFRQRYNLQEIGGLGDSFKIATGISGYRLHAVRGEKQGEGGFDKLDSLIAEYRPDVLILDPLIEFHSVDENSSELHLVMSNLTKLQNSYGCAAIVPHHASGKDFYTTMGRKVEKDAIDRARGHSSLVGWADTVLVVDRESSGESSRGFLRLTWAKCRRGKRPTNGICFVDYERMFVEWVCRLGSGAEAAIKSKYLEDYNAKFPLPIDT